MKLLTHQQGAALLSAMLTVTLVATFAASALWQQYRSLEVEKAERGRQQVAWLLAGALDWSRLILRIDGRAGTTDHLAEPWAVALQESRLSTFLAANQDNTGGMTAEESIDAFLSGQVEDIQSKLNVHNLVDNGNVSAPHLEAFSRLFKLLDIPQTELDSLVMQLKIAKDIRTSNPNAPLLPQNVRQLSWLGLSPITLQKLSPFITLVSEMTPVNLNTASAEVIFASVTSLQLADAKTIVSAREQKHFSSIDDAKARFTNLSTLSSKLHSVSTSFFEVRGRLRLEEIAVEEHSLVRRDGASNVQTQWRERAVVTSLQ